MIINIDSWNLDIVKAHQLWQGFQSMSGSKIGDCLNGDINIRDMKHVTFIRAYLKKGKSGWNSYFLSNVYQVGDFLKLGGLPRKPELYISIRDTKRVTFIRVYLKKGKKMWLLCKLEGKIKEVQGFRSKFVIRNTECVTFICVFLKGVNSQNAPSNVYI